MRRFMSGGAATLPTLVVLWAAASGGATELPAPPAVKSAVIDAAVEALNEEYIVPEKAAEMARSVRQKLEAGEYDGISTLSDFLHVLRDDLTEVSADRHIALWVMPPEQKAEEEANDREEMRLANHGFQRVEVLPGNVGYVDLRIFDSPGRAAPTAIAAMGLLAHVDSLIIDLRYNGGGDGNMVALLSSYFYDDNPGHHMDIRFRDRVEQTWTPAYVPGPDLSGVPLYVLTSGGTFSAAEDFAYGLQTRGRATIVGETTRGGAHPVTYRYFEDLNVEMMIPNASSTSPVTGGNWEGTGVVPDVEAPEVRAFGTAYVSALKSLLEGERDEGSRARLERALRRGQAALSPVTLGPEQLEGLAGDYGRFTLAVEEGHLYYVRDARSRYRLIPVTEDVFCLESDWAEFEFTRDDEGRVSAVVRIRQDGSRDTYPRVAAAKPD